MSSIEALYSNMGNMNNKDNMAGMKNNGKANKTKGGKDEMGMGKQGGKNRSAFRDIFGR